MVEIERALRIAREVLDLLQETGVEAALIWGSLAEQNRRRAAESDIDLLVVKDRLDLADSPNTQIMFGIPTRTIHHDGCKIDVFFVDRQYLQQAVKQKHWTAINAIVNGLVVIDFGVLTELRQLCSDFQAFSLSTSAEWFNQANNLLEKAGSLVDENEQIAAVILIRHAVDAMVHALIYSALGRPPSPRSFLTDLRDRISRPDLFELYLDSQGLRDLTTVDAMRAHLLALDFLDRVRGLIGREGTSL